MRAFDHPLSAVLLLSLSLLESSALAQARIDGYPDRVEAYDPREVALLPKYCKHTQLFRDAVPGGSNPAEIEAWRRLLGQTYIHMHHYCWGLMKTNRAMLLARNPQTKGFYLGSAVSEFDYVILSAPQDFVLLPEILTKKGENLIQLGEGPRAVAELAKAIELKPDYWPPYAALGDYYRKSGELAQARAILERGLAAAPDARALRRRLAELDDRGPKHGALQPAAGAPR